MNIPDILNYLCVIITVDITLITQNTKNLMNYQINQFKL